MTRKSTPFTEPSPLDLDCLPIDPFCRLCSLICRNDNGIQGRPGLSCATAHILCATPEGADSLLYIPGQCTMEQCSVLYFTIHCSAALSVHCTAMHRFTVDRSRHSGLCPGSGYCGEFVIPAQFQEICDSCPIPGDNSW